MSKINQMDMICENPLEMCLWVEELKKTESLNYCDLYGNTLLVRCCLNKKYSILAEYLLEAGADPNVSNRLGKTAIHYAIKYMGNSDLMKKLIYFGADIHYKDEKGKSALDGCDEMLAKNIREHMSLISDN